MKTSGLCLFIILNGFILFLSVACEKEKMPFEQASYIFETDSLTDIDGNVYKTVKIGDQWWMAENLRVRNYRNGTPLYYNSSFTADIWVNLKTGALCNLFDSSVPFNGPLYNWYAVSNPNGLAPENWRIPTEEDWKKLELFLGMHPDTLTMLGWRGTHEGEKLKLYGTNSIEWKIDRNINNTNQSGFSALPGGCRVYDGSFGDSGQYSIGFWWSATSQGNDQAWYRYLDYKYGGVFRYYAPKTSGFSIRCVKDE